MFDDQTNDHWKMQDSRNADANKELVSFLRSENARLNAMNDALREVCTDAFRILTEMYCPDSIMRKLKKRLSTKININTLDDKASDNANGG